MAIAPYLRRLGFDVKFDESEMRYAVDFNGETVARVDYVAVAHAVGKENLFVDEILRQRPDLAKYLGIKMEFTT